MKIKRIGYLLGAFLVLFTSLPVSAGAQATAGAQASGNCVRIIDSSPWQTTLEVRIEDFRVETMEIGGQTYQQWVVPGMQQNSRPGEIQVPLCGALLGFAALDELSVEVIQAEYDIYNGYRLAPVQSYDLSAVDEFSSDSARELKRVVTVELMGKPAGFFPGSLVEIGKTGYLRDQAFAQVYFYPVQYNPASGEVRLYRRILARVNVTPSRLSVNSHARFASPAYEALLKSALFNYTALGRDSLQANQSAPLLAESTPQAIASAGQQLKIAVDENGVYELTYDQLVAADYDFTGVDAHSLKIHNRGVEIPILVLGEDDSQFGPGDSILFYGVANTDVYTTVNIYWLSDGGAPGERMSSRSSPPGGGTPATEFPVLLHAEVDTDYWQIMPNGEGQDHWFWYSRISPNTQGLSNYHEYTLKLGNISTASRDTSLTVQLKGYTSDNYVNPDHKTSLTLNNQVIHAGQGWDGLAFFDLGTTFSHSVLHNGDNILKVQAVSPDPAPLVDQYFVNWIELNYWDTYVAEEDELLFGAPAAGTYRFAITNFNTNDIRVFDITDPFNVSQVTDGEISGAAPYQIEFEDDVTLDTRYLALTATKYKLPASLELDQASSWKSAANGADYILITHQDFDASAQVLADHHTATGLSVAVVDVEDIYDEFNYGIFNPQAIHDFLAYAYQNWSPPAPTYVLLLGGASYDYRDLLADVTRVNYVPSQEVETFYGQFPSDNWFVTISGEDVLPDMIISRLPADSTSEASAMVSKIIAYDQDPPDETWKENILLIADGGDDYFIATNEEIASTFRYLFFKNRIYEGQYSGDLKAGILSYINQGSLFTNFAGHGNPVIWGGFFNSSDVSALTNVGKYTIVTVGDCLSGFFTGMANPSMAEAFMQLPDKGAVAVWAPSSLGDPVGHMQMISEFYHLLYHRQGIGLGVASTAAKINVYSRNGSWGDLVETFILFGDPLTHVDVPDSVYLPRLSR